MGEKSLRKETTNTEFLVWNNTIIFKIKSNLFSRIHLLSHVFIINGLSLYLRHRLTIISLIKIISELLY